MLRSCIEAILQLAAQNPAMTNNTRIIVNASAGLPLLSLSVNGRFGEGGGGLL